MWRDVKVAGEIFIKSLERYLLGHDQRTDDMNTQKRIKRDM